MSLPTDERHAFDEKRMYAVARWDREGQPVNTSAAIVDAYEWLELLMKNKPRSELRRCMKQLVKFGSEVDSMREGVER